MIDTAAALAEALAIIKTANEVAVDLEADSMFHYQEKVCLIQMATDRINIVIDPLSIGDLSSLRPLFAKRAVKKVFHGADYDVRSLFRDFGIVIHNLFDTQVAAMFLGMRRDRFRCRAAEAFRHPTWTKNTRKRTGLAPPSPGYGRICGRGCDPPARPGTDYGNGARGKRPSVGGLKRNAGLLSQVRAAPVDDSPLFLRVKGAGKLDRRGLAVLENLLELRHRIARKKDRPLFKVFATSR